MNTNVQLVLPLLDFTPILKPVLAGGLAVTMALFALRVVWEFMRKGSL